MLGNRLLLTVPVALLVFHTACPSYDGVSLSRRKRFVVFPEGSTFSVAFCMTWKTLTEDLDIYTLGTNWAVSYELPNQTIRDPATHRIVPPFQSRRRRHELYSRLEAAMDARFLCPSSGAKTVYTASGICRDFSATYRYLGAGLEGRSCIKRALCETAQRLMPQTNILEEILRILFSLPLEKVDVNEPREHHEYDAAHRLGLSNLDCPELYSECSLSLVDMVLGT